MTDTFMYHVLGGLTWALDGASTRAYGVGIIGNDTTPPPPPPPKPTAEENVTTASASGGNLTKAGNAISSRPIAAGAAVIGALSVGLALLI